MLPAEQLVLAQAEGWTITTVVDNGTTAMYYMVVRHGPRFKSDLEAGAFVLAMTREGSALHREALRSVALSRVHFKPRKPRKS